MSDGSREEIGMSERAKELFLAYGGNRFFMDHDGVGAEYEGFRVPKETEARWAEEFIRDFLKTERYGKEALRACGTAAELVKRGSRDEWERCLFYPLRARYLDDVTRLFMLQQSFRMAETAVKKHTFSREDAAAYLKEFDAFSREIRDRAEKGALTRAADYVMQEFADPEYTACYLDEMKKKWLGLF